jgi:Cys-tRNA(Pro)/Cys-tRNA(Cys) deacylase
VAAVRRACSNTPVAETRGTRYLRQQGVAFELLTYRHDRKGAAFAAEALGIPLTQFAKTLVVAAGEPVLVLMGGDRELSLRKLARARGVKEAAMADPKDAERLTGYLVGGIGPFGTRRPLPVLADAALQQHERIAVNAGGRGVIVELAREDLLRLTRATVADLAQDR